MNRIAALGTDFSSMSDQAAYDGANRLEWGNLTDEQKSYFKDNNFGFNFGSIADFGAWNDAGKIAEDGGTGESDPSPSPSPGPVGNPPGDR